MKVVDVVKHEVETYLGHEAQIAEGVMFSQHKLVRRIGIFKNRHFPKGKIDKRDGSYKYWFDIISLRVNAEIKNLRFDSNDVLPFSTNPIQDFSAIFTLRAALNEWMWETGREEEMIDAIERFSADGNVLFKKVKGGYETCDPENTFIINQSAKTIEQTPIVERVQMTQSELRAKAGVWSKIDEVIANCGNKFFQKTPWTGMEITTNPLYEIFERNGEISEAALFEAQGKEGGDENKYQLTRIIVAGLGNNKDEKRYVLFAEPLTGEMCDWFAEAHRGPYKGRWWREGIYEILFDHQYRANEIGNQLARGLDWASKVIFKDSDPRVVQNIRTDVANGQIIKSINLTQVDVRMQGLDQLIADWNRLMQDADSVANSYAIVQGDLLPSHTSFQLAKLVNTNASKLFVFLRGKLGHAYARVFKEFVLPELVKNIKAQDIIRVTGDADFLDRFRMLAVEGWYIDNLASIGPHTKEMGDALKQQKLEEMQQTDPLIKNIRAIWDGILPRIQITITGENYEFAEEMHTISSVLEQDPVRRAFLLDTIYSAKGIPVPPAVQPQPQAQPQPQSAPSPGAPKPAPSSRQPAPAHA
jgi:hypothetical protein